MSSDERQQLKRHSYRVAGFSLTAILLGIFFLDLIIANFFNREELKSVYYYSREITNIGYSIHYFTIALIGIVFSKLIYPRVLYFQKKISAEKNLHIFSWSWFSIKVLLIIGIPLHLVKFLFGRMRPHISGNFNPQNFDFLNMHHHWHSMPSGHSQVLFTVATIALLIWPRQKYLFLLAALMLSLTRVSIHQHFFSDMLAGAAIGYLGTLWLFYYYKPNKVR